MGARFLFVSRGSAKYTRRKHGVAVPHVQASPFTPRRLSDALHHSQTACVVALLFRVPALLFLLRAQETVSQSLSVPGGAIY